MSNDIPADIIQAVSVVPILAPIITEMACANVNKPALTNDTVITVVAVDDCTDAVTSIPVSIPVKRLVVIKLLYKLRPVISLDLLNDTNYRNQIELSKASFSGQPIFCNSQ